MARGRSPKSQNPLSVAAAAIARALDPLEPSRVTLLRLLGDSIRLLEDFDASHGTKTNEEVMSGLLGLSEDAFVSGSQALAAAAFTCLMRLGTRGGPLRGRAIKLLRRAGRIGGQKFIAQAASDARNHIAAMKKEGSTSKSAFEGDLASALLVLAEASTVQLAGVQGASQSILFLLSPKMRQRISRSDSAMAAAHIFSSFTTSCPPPVNVVDKVVDFSLASASSKLGVGGIGSALLAGSVVPFVMDRGEDACESLLSSAALALRVSPTHFECSAWAVTVARGALGKEMNVWKRKNAILSGSPSNSKERGAQNIRSEIPPRQVENTERDTVDGNLTECSANIGAIASIVYESTIVYVAKVTGLRARLDGCVWSMAGVIRMWALACPTQKGDIPGRVVVLLKDELSDGATLSCVREAVVMGLWDQLEPRNAQKALSVLLAASENLPGLASALALILSAELVRLFDLDAMALLIAPGGELESAIGRCHIALASSCSIQRHGGVCLISSIAGCSPHLRAPLVTGILQNLRIADMQLAMKPTAKCLSSEKAVAAQSDSEIFVLLGNAAALAALVEEVSLDPASVPAALLTQCAIDAEALLKPHVVASSSLPNGRVAANTRRRLGWALLAALSRTGFANCFTEERVRRLRVFWQEELGYLVLEQGSRLANRLERPSKVECNDQDSSGGDNSSQHYSRMRPETDTTVFDIDEIVSESSARAAALVALAQCIRCHSSPEFEELAVVLIGGAAARISADDLGIIAPRSFSAFVASATAGLAGVANLETRGAGLSIHQSLATGQAWSGTKKKASSDRVYGKERIGVNYVEPRSREVTQLIAQMHMIEAECLLECVQLLPPSGPAANLCYHVASAMLDEAQRSLEQHAHTAGATGMSAINGRPIFGLANPRTAASGDEEYIGNQRRNLGGRRFVTCDSLLHNAKLDTVSQNVSGFLSRSEPSLDASTNLMLDGGTPRDLMWLFDEEGHDILLSERLLVACANATAALVAKELVVSGSILDSIVSTTDLSPAFCASVVLALTRRLSASDFSATGRVLASLQVLLRRSLVGSVISTPTSSRHAPVSTTGAVASVQNRLNPRDGRILSGGAPCNLNERPGRFLESQIYNAGWHRWARSFSLEVADKDDSCVARFSRVFNITSASRFLTTEAYKELSEKGGAALWFGITSGIIEMLREHLGKSAPSSVSIAASTVVVLGELLTYLPHQYRVSDGETHDIVENAEKGTSWKYSREVAALIDSGTDVIVCALQHHDVFVRASASTALSDSSLWVASNSNRLMPELLSAWASDRHDNEISASRHVHLEEAGLCAVAFNRILNGMIQDVLPKPASSDLLAFDHPFFAYDSHGPRNCAGAFGIGAAAVLSACRLHWETFSESCAGAGEEIASDLMEWSILSSPRTVAAGLYCLASLWATRIDVYRANAMTSQSSETDKKFIFSPRSPNIPSSPHAKFVPSSPMIMQIGEELELSTDEGSSNAMGRPVPLEVFAVADVPLENTIARIMECLLVSGRQAHQTETRTGAIAAITQIIRGAGAKVVIDLYPNLPLLLFSSTCRQAPGSRRVLEYLARADGRRRLHYWIHLCHQVFFVADSDNESLIGLGLDVASSRTRTLALTIAIIAVESAVFSTADGPAELKLDRSHESMRQLRFSFDGVRSLTLGSHVKGLDEMSRIVANCLPGIVRLASEACLNVKINAAGAAEGCRLISLVFSVVAGLQQLGELEKKCLDVYYPSIATALRAVMEASSPPHAVAAAAACLSQILAPDASPVDGQHVLFDSEIFEALFMDGKLDDLHVRYKYDRYSEDIGAESALCVLSHIAAVATRAQAFAALRCDHPLEIAVRPFRRILRSLLVACVADFAAMLNDGAAEQAALGSSLTASGCTVHGLEASFMRHIGAITCGAASLLDISEPVRERDDDLGAEIQIEWHNPRAPGVLLLKDAGSNKDDVSIDSIVLSVLVWLVGQKGSDIIEGMENPLSDATSANTYGCATHTNSIVRLASLSLPILMANSRILLAYRLEALLSLRCVDANGALEVCRSLASMDLNTPDQELLLLQAAALCIDELTCNGANLDFELAFHALSLLLPRLESVTERKLFAEKFIDVILFLVNLPPGIDLHVLVRPGVQSRMNESLAFCVAVLPLSRVRVVVQTIDELVRRFVRLGKRERLGALSSLAVCIGKLFPELGAEGICQLLAVGDDVVDSMLLCDGGPDFIVGCLHPEGPVGAILSTATATHILGALLGRVVVAPSASSRIAIHILVEVHAQDRSGRLSDTILSALLPRLTCRSPLPDLESGQALTTLCRKDEEFFKHELEKLPSGARNLAETIMLHYSNFGA